MLRLLALIIYFVSLYFLTFWLLVFVERGAPPHKLKKFKKEKVTIVIPAWNEEKNIGQCIMSVLRLNYPKNKVEIIIVDDGSRDNTSLVVEKLIKKYKDRNIRLIRQKNKGKAVAMNTGLAKATGKFFVSLDADSTIKRDALNKILPLFTSKNVAAVLPLIRVERRNTLMRRIQHCEYLINFFYKRLMSNLNCVHVTPGPFSVYRKNIIERLGGYDEGNLVEDLEMAFRLQKNHYELIQLLETHAYTKAPPTLVQFYKQRNRWYKGSLLNLLDKKYRGMMFNKKYGDLGFFQFPMIIISAFLSLALMVIVLGIYIIKPIIVQIHSTSFIKFQILPLLQNFFSNFKFIDIPFVPLFYGVSIIALALVFISRAHYYTKENLANNLKYILLYLILYPFIISAVWIGVGFDLLIKRKQRW